MPKDYIQRLLAAWQADTGLVCSPPAGCRPIGPWGHLEFALLNSHQARAQYFADSIGIGFAQGKTMLWRRADLEAAGGIKALGAEIAEDAASPKIVRAAGLRVRLTAPPFGPGASLVRRRDRAGATGTLAADTALSAAGPAARPAAASAVDRRLGRY